MSGKKEMSISCRIDLSGVVQDLQGIKKSTIRPVEGAKGPPLLELFAEEVRSLREEGTKISAVMPIFMSKLGLPADGPLAVAGYQVALKEEEDVPNAPNYHNQQHVLEVLLASYVLGRREHLPIYRIAELLIAATAHDLGHNGEMNRCDFERETISVQLAEPILREAGLPDETIQRIRHMILATDIKAGVPAARGAYLSCHHLPPTDEQRLLATQILLLVEADVLFSCFDLSYNDLLSKLLSAEWKRPSVNLSANERLGFLKSVQFLSDASRQLGLEERRKILVSKLSASMKENPPS